MTLVRNPPSGPPVIFDADVLSVFGRTGHVVAAVGDYTEALVFNDSSVPGFGDLATALDTIRNTDGIDNQSGATGGSVTDALDGLLSRSGGVPGYIRDTFTGGALVASISSNTNARLGDRRWNFHTNQANGSAIKRAGSGGHVGVYRVTNSHIYLGANGIWPIQAQNWSEFTFRCRVEAVMTAGEVAQFGLSSSLTLPIRQATGAGFSAAQNSSPNFTTTTSLAGSAENQDTGVAIDGNFHTFRAVRVSASEVQFFIDGVLRTTHLFGFVQPAPTSEMGPIVGAFGNLSTTFTDVDDFEFIPT